MGTETERNTAPMPRWRGGRLAWALDRYGESRKHYAAARKIYETLGDEDGIGIVEMLSGFINRGDQRVDESEANFRLALELGRKTATST